MRPAGQKAYETYPPQQRQIQTQREQQQCVPQDSRRVKHSVWNTSTSAKTIPTACLSVGHKQHRTLSNTRPLKEKSVKIRERLRVQASTAPPQSHTTTIAVVNVRHGHDSHPSQMSFKNTSHAQKGAVIKNLELTPVTLHRTLTSFTCKDKPYHTYLIPNLIQSFNTIPLYT